jgi:hypothetical protein
MGKEIYRKNNSIIGGISTNFRPVGVISSGYADVGPQINQKNQLNLFIKSNKF